MCGCPLLAIPAVPCQRIVRLSDARRARLGAQYNTTQHAHQIVLSEASRVVPLPEDAESAGISMRAHFAVRPDLFTHVGTALPCNSLQVHVAAAEAS